MAMERPKKGRRVKNISKQKPVNKQEAKNIANKEITLRKFNPDYDMVLKRISNAPEGLRCGAPPGRAS